MTWGCIVIEVRNLSKTFTLHTQGGVSYTVLKDISFQVNPGECLVLNGPSGAGKSTLLRALYANYKIDQGDIVIQHNDKKINIAIEEPRSILNLRRTTIGYVSQFLRVIPRVSAIDVVCEPLMQLGIEREEAYQRAHNMLTRLNIPERLFSLAPATFSGGEQQRINIARGFLPDYPCLLLDEPTASLDAENRQVVIDLIQEAKAKGSVIVGIFHDAEVREAVATNFLNMSSLDYAA